MNMFNPYCLSSYLGLRYVPDAAMGWKEDLVPGLPDVCLESMTPVRSAADVLSALKQQLAALGDLSATGILLSGGIDSAILAALLPAGTRAYTIHFVADGAVDESVAAAGYAEHYALNHTTVHVTWDDYQAGMDDLMRRKKSPLHAVEVGLYKASRAARADGVNRLVVGNGADSTFGGLDKLLSKEWTFNAFVARYTFLDPALALKDSVSLVEVFEPYRRDETGIDVNGFLKEVHGLGIIQAFNNSIRGGGCALAEPFEQLRLDGPLDLERIRAGQSKYILRDVFRELYHGLQIPEKIAFARPMDLWLADWMGPRRHEFLDGLSMDAFTGDQKWLLYCLERFLEIHDT